MILTPDSIDQYLNSIYERGGSPNTMRSYKTDLTMLMEAVGNSPTESDVANYLNAVRVTHKPKSVKRKLGAFRGYAKFHGERAFLVDYRAPVPARPEPHPLPEGLDGVRRMVACTYRLNDRALLALCGFCGLRIGEAISISWEDIDEMTRTVSVRGKGDRTRIVPISEEAWSLIEPAYKYARAYRCDLIRIADRTARRRITELGIKAGLERPIKSHDLRMTFGTAVYHKTKDLRVVQELLGHADSHTTEVYTGVSSEHRRSAVEGL